MSNIKITEEYCLKFVVIKKTMLKSVDIELHYTFMRSKRYQYDRESSRFDIEIGWVRQVLFLIDFFYPKKTLIESTDYVKN